MELSALLISKPRFHNTTSQGKVKNFISGHDFILGGKSSLLRLSQQGETLSLLPISNSLEEQVLAARSGESRKCGVQMKDFLPPSAFCEAGLAEERGQTGKCSQGQKPQRRRLLQKLWKPYWAYSKSLFFTLQMLTSILSCKCLFKEQYLLEVKMSHLKKKKRQTSQITMQGFFFFGHTKGACQILAPHQVFNHCPLQ